MIHYNMYLFAGKRAADYQKAACAVTAAATVLVWNKLRGRWVELFGIVE